MENHRIFNSFLSANIKEEQYKIVVLGLFVVMNLVKHGEKHLIIFGLMYYCEHAIA